MMQFDIQAGEVDLALGKDVVIEENEAVVDLCSRLPQGVAEIDLAASVGREILYEERAPTFQEFAFDLRVAAKALRLFADVLHRQHELVSNPCRKWDARCLAARNVIDRLVTNLRENDGCGELH